MLGTDHRVLSTNDVPAEEFAGFPNFLLKRIADPVENGASKSFRISHTTVGPLGGTHKHLHKNSDEAWYIVAGGGHFFCDGALTPFDAGDFLFAERNAIHQVINTGSEALIYIAFTSPPCDFVNDNIVIEEFSNNTIALFHEGDASQ